MSNNQKFIEQLNAIIGNKEITAVEHPTQKNAFFIKLTNPFIESNKLIPTDQLIDAIKIKSLVCLGAEIRFNNLHNTFWVNI